MDPALCYIMKDRYNIKCHIYIWHADDSNLKMRMVIQELNDRLRF